MLQRLRVLRFGIWNLVPVLLAVVVTGCSSPADRAESYYKRGMALIAKGDDLNARLELLNAVKYKSDKIDAWRALEGVDERTKAAQALFQDLRKIVELDPNDLEARLKLSRILVGAGAADAALKMVDAANEGGKPSAALHGLKAMILSRTNDPPGAVREAEQAFEIDPNNVDAVSLLASKKLADGDADGALKLLDTLKLDQKDETRVLLQKIQLYGKKGDLSQAVDLLRRVISLNPKESSLRSQLIQLLVAQRRFDEAEKELRARVEENPADPKGRLDLVRLLNLVKGPDAARAELEAGIRAGGDIFDYQIALAELNLSQSRINDAITALQTLTETASTSERKLAAKVKLAEIYVSRSNLTAAEPLISDILKSDRRNAGALRLRAMISIDKGQIDSAVSDLRAALNDQPKSRDLLILLAVAYERGGKYELADRQYADALKSSGWNPDVALRYVAFLQRRGDVSHAEDILTEVSGRYPNNVQVLSSLAQLRLSRQNWAGALAVAEAIARSGEVSVADQIRAAAFAGQNKIDESIAALEDAHKIAPAAVQPVLSLASAYMRQGQPDKAMALLQDVNEKFPANAQILVLIGQVKLAQKKNDEALQSFKAAIERQPKDPIGYSALSDLYIRQKDYDSAGSVLQAGLREQPENLNFRLSFAGLQILRGDYNAAIAQYEAILKDQPNSLVAINNLASLLLDYRSDKESLGRAFSLADLLKNSNVPQFQDTLGWAQYRQGDYKNAVSTLEGALDKMPNLAAVHYHLAMGYTSVGLAEKATEQFKAALTLEPDGTALKESIRSAMSRN